jgi:hypothetical protein
MCAADVQCSAEMQGHLQCSSDVSVACTITVLQCLHPSPCWQPPCQSASDTPPPYRCSSRRSAARRQRQQHTTPGAEEGEARHIGTLQATQ